MISSQELRLDSMNKVTALEVIITPCHKYGNPRVQELDRYKGDATKLYTGLRSPTAPCMDAQTLIEDLRRVANTSGVHWYQMCPGHPVFHALTKGNFITSSRCLT